MFHLKPLLCLAAALALCCPAWAINKCTDSAGKTSFQDAPCPGGKGQVLDVRPASGEAPTSTDGNGPPGFDVKRAEAEVAASVNARRLQELETVFAPNSVHAVTAHREACEKEQADLQAKRYAVSQNRFGRDESAQLANEIRAAGARCVAKDQELKASARALMVECRELGGCSRGPAR